MPVSRWPLVTGGGCWGPLGLCLGAQVWRAVGDRYSGCVCCGESQVRVTGFAVPRGRTKTWWSLRRGLDSASESPKLQWAVHYLPCPLPHVFFKPRLLKKHWKLFVWGWEFLEASCWFCSPGTGLLGFLSTSEVETVLAIVQVKHCSRYLLLIASVTSVMGLQCCYFIFKCTFHFIGTEEGKNENYAIVPSSRACCGWQLLQHCTGGAVFKLFLLLSCCLLWGLSVT